MFVIGCCCDLIVVVVVVENEGTVNDDGKDPDRIIPFHCCAGGCCYYCCGRPSLPFKSGDTPHHSCASFSDCDSSFFDFDSGINIIAGL